jgi:hypothetical protein
MQGPQEMRQMYRRILLFDTLLMLSMSAGCVSHDPATRRQQLLELYPPGVTSLNDVHSKWQPASPLISAIRPADDWPALANTYVRDHALAAQRRTDQPVFRCEMFRGADGLSGGLCRCWFYYDQNEMLVDAEWEWNSD